MGPEPWNCGATVDHHTAHQGCQNAIYTLFVVIQGVATGTVELWCHGGPPHSSSGLPECHLHFVCCHPRSSNRNRGIVVPRWTTTQLIRVARMPFTLCLLSSKE